MKGRPNSWPLSIASLYYDQGKYAEAEPLNQRALAIWEKALGPEHPDVARSLNNLAMVYTDQGKYEEAIFTVTWGFLGSAGYFL